MEFIGYWWVSNYNELTGTLRKVEDDFILELLGSFDDDLGFDLKKYECIHGFTKCGKTISLLNCFCTGTECNMPGIPYTMYQPSHVIIGDKHYDTLEDINIKSWELNFDYLDAWIDKSKVTMKTDKEHRTMTLDTETLKCINHKLINFDLDIIFSNNTKMNSIFTEFSWKQSSKLKITFNNDISYKDALIYIYDLEDFLSFNIGQPVQCREISGTDIDGNRIMVIQPNTTKPLKTMQRADASKSLILYADIEDIFTEVYNKWISYREKLKPIISKMLLSEKEGKYYDIQLHFMNIIMSLETFSRRFMNNHKMDNTKHETMIKTIISSITNEEYKEWLSYKLNYSNEPTLNNRLKEVFDRTASLIKISNKKRNSLIYKTVNTRNYYTHFGEDKKIEEMFTTVESFYVYNYYKLCLKLLILDELGIKMENLINNPNKKWVKDFQWINEFKKQFDIK
ncbi:ApeA N-terminal domain 1-containing protein [Clostridium perfringens]|uniref:ApeA N-terminal domain 1-containing protein n=3 Tax=Clostridium perfringens TaxID=1502 RepID=UPI001A313390|nr:HEPN domain-containing protein [Clostridium perfringens]MCX0392331.1 hypothetical protein [Clostridium perfringens]MDU3644019.1 hypothetical protein [Clostridium perfringens]HAT4301371.1 hypothetical protein [Clostridium perfringens]HBI6903606.1 hypothetical protein [Clostridium perfringens]